MSLDFSPYQSEEPQISRNSYSASPNAPVDVRQREGLLGSSRSGNERINQYETRLPIRLDVEAMLCYLMLPPAGSVILLILETRNDFVRFHAWQSALLFAPLVVLHLILSFSPVLSWMLFAVDLLLIAGGAYRAFRDSDSLDRYQIPWIGQMASNYVDDE